MKKMFTHLNLAIDKTRHDKIEDERKLHVPVGFEPALSLDPPPCQTEEPSEQVTEPSASTKTEPSDSGHSPSHSTRLEYTFVLE
ncbi:hypothetical protein PoB_004692300 [Plakobranchus ocellatus]|uniref:Uncharacterized protein n=1 Tax=Plakobranchus ocellatus TaxID=259542 RepID=A0AAV4BMR0_9GAST|nr:hypothetical protein PoB_004692300 [Plakobranchus ocellatus]